MKILVTGVAGQLGHDVMNELHRRGLEGIGSDIAPSYVGADDHSPVTAMPYVQMDITNPEAVRSVVEECRPDAVIHCAAWTAVDAAEDPGNLAKVKAINEDGTRLLAHACRDLDAKMMYISTDYVFNGQGTAPWEPDCREYAPLNVYGQTKLAGELAVSSLLTRFFIVRIAWVFGLNGNNYIKTMLRLGRSHDHLRIVCDQIGTPTYTRDLAVLLCDMIATERYGWYHATNSEVTPRKAAETGCPAGYISWYDFSVEIFRQAAQRGFDAYRPERLSVEPVTTAEYGLSKAARPFNSRLDKSKLSEAGFAPLPDWQDAVRRFLDEINMEEYR